MIKYNLFYPEKKCDLIFLFDEKYKCLESFLNSSSSYCYESDTIIENCNKAIKTGIESDKVYLNFGNLFFGPIKTHIDLVDNEYYDEVEYRDESEREIRGEVDVPTKELIEIIEEIVRRDIERLKIMEIYEDMHMFFTECFRILPGFLCSEIKLRDKEKNLKLFSEILNENEIKKMCGDNFEAEIGGKITKLKCLEYIKHEAYYNDTAVIETKKLFEYIKEYYKLMQAKVEFYKEVGKEPEEIEKMWFY